MKSTGLEASWRILILQLASNPVDFIHNVLHILFARFWHCVEHHPEKVGEPFVRKWLVANHEGPLQNHLLLDFWCNSSNLFPPGVVFSLASQPLRYVPKAKVCALSG